VRNPSSHGLLIPSYPLPPSCDKTEILRVVVRESLSGDLIRKLIADIFEVTERLLDGDGPSVAMLLAASRNARAGAQQQGQGQDQGKTPEKHKDMSEDHKAKIAVSAGGFLVLQMIHPGWTRGKEEYKDRSRL
jgi:hypothetical protein